MSNPIQIVSNNYTQTKDIGLSETQSGTIRQSSAQLKQMFPKNLPMDKLLRADTSLTDTANEKCRNYSGLKGLRQLKNEQKDLSIAQPKCGWMYKASAGVNPLVSRGAFGTRAGPTNGKPGEKDDMSNGVKWYSDLNQAEMDISTALCTSIQSCKDMAKLGSQAEYVGFCKTTGAIIPVVRNSKGRIQARYKINGMGCEKKNIVTSENLNRCPSGEGFKGDSRQQNLHSTHVRNEEGFFSGGEEYDEDDGDDGEDCDSIPLSRNCVIKAAQFAGCSDRGSLIHSLEQGDPTGKQGYDSVLRANPSFQAFQSLMNPRLNDSVLKDGSASIQTAIDSFSQLPSATTNDNNKISLAATDLCVNKGAYDAYDFCSEISPTTTITDSNSICLQNFWKEAGGTVQGSAYSTLLKDFKGKLWSSFTKKIEEYKEAVRVSYLLTYENESAQKTRNKLLKEFLGIYELESNKIPLNEKSSRGVECIWVRRSDWNDGVEVAIVLGEQLLYASNGAVYPSIREGNHLRAMIGISRGVSLYAIQEPRSVKGGNILVAAKTDGSTFVSHTINGSSNESRTGVVKLINGRKASDLLTVPYMIAEENKQKTTILITEVVSITPSPSFQLTSFNSQPGMDLENFAHFPQETSAPWLRFEVCDRVNFGKKKEIILQEPRFGAMREFQISSQSIGTILTDRSRKELPGENGYVSFSPNSLWKTKSRLAYTGFRTITVLFRPTATMSPGAQAYLFAHAYRPNPTTYFGFYTSFLAGNILKTEVWDQYGNYYKWNIPYYVNEWNLLVVQYVKHKETTHGKFEPIYGITTSCFRFKDLQTKKESRTEAFYLLSRQREQAMNTSKVFYPPVDDRPGPSQWAGNFYLGRLDHYPFPSFTGDVAWVHGYRAAFDTSSMLDKEINESWKSSWFEPNLFS